MPRGKENSFENFEEWFAIRLNHQDKEFWPGRLKFDVKEGIELLAIQFLDSLDQFSEPTFRENTITGYIDYQKPATLVLPFIQSYGGTTFSSKGTVQRISYKIRANAILTNIHLSNISEKCFTELSIDLPALQFWLNPKQLVFDKKFNKIELKKETINQFYINENKLTIENYVILNLEQNNKNLLESTRLNIVFKNEINFNEIINLLWKLEVVFDFMIGFKVDIGIPKTKTKNNEEINILYRKHKKTNKIYQSEFEPLTTEYISNLKINDILSICLNGNDKLISVMELILSAEEYDFEVSQRFMSLIAALEDFDQNQFGSGANSDLRLGRKNLETFIKINGTAAQLAMFKRLSSNSKNNFSLVKRLERLAEHWQQDGFREYPDFSHMRDIRNNISHGRGGNMSPKAQVDMFNFSKYLAALARYHVWRSIGLSVDTIAFAFLNRPHIFGQYVPTKYIDQR